MNIRIAQTCDIPTLQQMNRDHASGSQYNKDKVDNFIAGCVQTGRVLVAVVDDKVVGFMAGNVQESLFTDDVFFIAMVLYFKEGYSIHVGRFLGMVNDFLDAMTKATKLVIAVPYFHANNERLYELKGFQKLETHWVRDIV